LSSPGVILSRSTVMMPGFLSVCHLNQWRFVMFTIG